MRFQYSAGCRGNLTRRYLYRLMGVTNRGLRARKHRPAAGPISSWMKQDLALRAGKIATRVRRPQGCIHPTDYGSQHCAHDDQKLLRQPGMKASMGGNGNC